MRGLTGDHRNALNTRRAGSNYGNPFTGEVDALVGPPGSLKPTALECFQALVFGLLGDGQTAGRQDAELHRNGVAAVGLNGPAIRGLIEQGGGYPRVELYVTPEIKAISDVIE